MSEFSIEKLLNILDMSKQSLGDIRAMHASHGMDDDGLCRECHLRWPCRTFDKANAGWYAITSEVNK